MKGLRTVMSDVTQAMNLHIILGLTNYVIICFEVQLTAITYKTVINYSNSQRRSNE